VGLLGRDLTVALIISNGKPSFKRSTLQRCSGVGWGCSFAMDETGDRVLTTEFDTICALQVRMRCSQVVALESVVGDIGTLDTLHWSKRVRLQEHWNPTSST
jgi:hypothetical protein